MYRVPLAKCTAGHVFKQPLTIYERAHSLLTHCNTNPLLILKYISFLSILISYPTIPGSPKESHTSSFLAVNFISTSLMSIPSPFALSHQYAVLLRLFAMQHCPTACSSFPALPNTISSAPCSLSHTFRPVPLLRPLVTDVRFNPWPVHVEFVADNVTLDKFIS